MDGAGAVCYKLGEGALESAVCAVRDVRDVRRLERWWGVCRAFKMGRQTAMDRARDWRRGALPTNEGVIADAWRLRAVDELTGEVLTAEEAAYRAVMRSEYEQGLIAMDATYYAERERIHEPFSDAHGSLSAAQEWELTRENSTTLRIPLRDIGDPTRLPDGLDAVEGVAVRFAHALCGPRAARVMHVLYAIANEPPNWRRPRFTVSLAELADRMGYTRDERGVHRDYSRKELSRILLALHYTHVGVQRTADGESRGVMAPLLSRLEYSTRENASGLSPQRVFELGLPDNVTVEIGWFSSLRDAEGHPVHAYVRVLPPARGTARGRSNRTGVSTIDNLRQQILQYRKTVRGTSIELARAVLLEQAGITNRNVTNASKSLRRALDALAAEGTLSTYGPVPLPLRPTELIYLRWEL